MGKGKESRPPKPSKPASCIQEITTTSYPHWSIWSRSMQAYYGAMPPSLFPPFVASPTPHPYPWGSQHPLIPSHGTSAPYPTLYNHGSSSNAKQIANKKAASSPFSPSHFLISAKSGTEGTSDARNENNDQQDFAGSREDDFQEMVADGANAQSTTIGGTAEASVYGKPISMPKTNCPLPTLVPPVDGNETVCDLELDEKGDNDMEEHENVEEPKYGMKFSSEQELCIYYKQYAKKTGFGLIHQRSKKKPGGKVKYLTLACARFGKARPSTSNVSKPCPTTKTKCKAKINAMFVFGYWLLTTVELAHNHALSPDKSIFFRGHTKLDPIMKRKIELKDRAERHMSKSFNPLVEGEGVENLSSVEKDRPNFIDEERYLQLGKGGAAALCEYFQRMREKSDAFYSVMNFNDDNRLRNVFWADLRSRAAYKSFGDVVTFDTTCLTNRHKIPFVLFMGVNHHGQSIFFGAGLISSEDADTFIWLFQTFLKCMNGQIPSAIVTDQDKAIKSAVAIVFPRTQHRFCLWHIMRKLPEKLGSHAQYTCGLKSVIQNCLYDSQTCDEFEKSWQTLLDTYNLHDNAWLHELYSERTYWVPAYLKDVFWAGMSITRRSESVNTYFDGFLHSKTTLKDFFGQFDRVLRKKIDNEETADFNSFNSMIPCISHSLIEKKFQEMYTIAKFKEVQQEFLGMISCNCSLIKIEGAVSTYQVSDMLHVDDSIKQVAFWVYFNEDECEMKCICGLFEIRGILCRHALAVFFMRRIRSLPSKYILDRWRKDLYRRYTFINIYDDLRVKRYNALVEKFSELAMIAASNEDCYKALMHLLEMLKKKYCGLR